MTRTALALAASAVLVFTACSDGDGRSVPTSSAPSDDVASDSPDTSASADGSPAPPTAGASSADDVATTTPEGTDGVDASPQTSATITSESATADDLARFVAATEDAIDNTSYAGAIFDEPEIYIALGEAACARFSAGESFAQIASDMLADLGSDDSADDERLVGAIIGAASRTICPEHADKI